MSEQKNLPVLPPAFAALLASVGVLPEGMGKPLAFAVPRNPEFRTHGPDALDPKIEVVKTDQANEGCLATFNLEFPSGRRYEGCTLSLETDPQSHHQALIFTAQTPAGKLRSVECPARMTEPMEKIVRAAGLDFLLPENACRTFWLVVPDGEASVGLTTIARRFYPGANDAWFDVEKECTGPYYPNGAAPDGESEYETLFMKEDAAVRVAIQELNEEIEEASQSLDLLNFRLGELQTEEMTQLDINFMQNRIGAFKSALEQACAAAFNPYGVQAIAHRALNDDAMRCNIASASKASAAFTGAGCECPACEVAEEQANATQRIEEFIRR